MVLRKSRTGVVSLVAAVLTLVASPAKAQVLYGSITGTVADASDAAVPEATVTITQTQTNQSRVTTTNAAGGYNFSNATVGDYTVVITKKGFESYTTRGIAVALNGVVRVNARLNVGSVAESIVVTSEAALLQADRADVHSEITTRSLQEVPVASRSFQALLGLMPGASTPNYFQGGGINNPSRSMTVTINGTPNSNVVVRIDGVSATNQWIQPLQAYTPGIESIESVNSVTSSFDAEQGMAGGASINVQVKSGTNQLHGSAFEYVENRALTARNFFLPAGTPKPKGSWNIFGGTVGGPILKNKLFYFASWEDNLQRATGGAYGSTGTFSTLPPASLRTGNFSQTGTAIYDPATGAADGSGRTAFPGGIIPATRLDKITTQNFLGRVPLPVFDTSTNNYFSNPAYSATYSKLDGKVSWAVNSKLNVNTRIGYLADDELTAGRYPNTGTFNPISGGTTNSANVITGTVSANYLVSPSFLVDGLYGLTRQHTLQVGGDGKCYGVELGIPGDCQPGFRDPGTPAMNITGYAGIGGGNLTDYLDPQYQFVANAAWIKSSHNLRFGVDVHRLHINHYEVNTGAPRSMTFTGGVTSLKGGVSPNQYNALADFLLGLPQSLTTGLDNPPLNSGADPARPATTRTWEMGLYIRDQWQASRKLTVSYGTRWEYYPVPTRADRGIEIFDFSSLTSLVCGIGKTPGNCGVHVSPLQFAPRLGIAYRATDSFVIRAGFSLNWQQDAMYRQGVYAFPTQISISKSGATTLTPVGTVGDGLPAISPIDVSSGIIRLPAGAGVTTLPKDFVRGYIMSWNFTMQKSLGHGWTAQAGYVGNRAIHQDQSQNLNYGLPGGGSASQPFFKSLGTTAAVNVYLPMAHTYYDSLQATVNRRFTSGFSVSSSYTFSKALTNFAGNIPIPEYFHLNKGLQGSGGLGMSGDQRQRFTLASTYELPFGKGKAYSSQNRVLSALMGGWQINGLLAAYAGTPFSVTASNTSLNAGGIGQRANQVVKDVNILGGIGLTQPYFDPLAFAPVTCACFGTAGFNTLRGPAAANVDAGLFRQFPITERIGLQFRAEVFNVTNTPHFSTPSGTNVSSMQVGANNTILNLNGYSVITSTVSGGRDYDQRYLRLGMRLSW